MTHEMKVAAIRGAAHNVFETMLDGLELLDGQLGVGARGGRLLGGDGQESLGVVPHAGIHRGR